MGNYVKLKHYFINVNKRLDLRVAGKDLSLENEETPD